MPDSKTITNVISIFNRLQGIGTRSAKRIVIDLIKKKEQILFPLIEQLNILYKEIKTCEICYNIDTTSPCSICQDTTRDSSILCIVEYINSLWAIEKSSCYKGIYFVLGNNLSALHQKTPDKLNIDKLIKNISQNNNIQEVLFALSSTIEGQITSNYIQEELEVFNLKITTLAKGIPMGGEIDYLDDVTIETAIKLRKEL
jgi:recombination protein RecR